MNPSSFMQVDAEGPVTGAGVFTATDGIIFGAIVLLIAVIAWLSHREIRISRNRAGVSEQLLETERDSLERRIAERTAAFVRAEEQHMRELQRNAEFGKLAQGLFHDLMTPLSSISLHVQEKGAQQEVRGIIDASRRLNSFMESVKRSFGQDVPEQQILQENADLGAEIAIVQDILGYKARMAGVEIDVQQKESVHLPIHPVRLHQLILNLVSNAIDACTEATYLNGETDHVVTISVIKNDQHIQLSVSDTGYGISPENQKRLFTESFTTKKGGSGIGLITIKTIVEKDLKGTIEVKSEEGKGATFVITIPKV